MKLKDAEKGKFYKLSHPRDAVEQLWILTPVIENGHLMKSPFESGRYLAVTTAERGTVLSSHGNQTNVYEVNFNMKELRRRIFGSIFRQFNWWDEKEKDYKLIADTIKG